MMLAGVGPAGGEEEDSVMIPRQAIPQTVPWIYDSGRAPDTMGQDVQVAADKRFQNRGVWYG